MERSNEGEAEQVASQGVSCPYCDGAVETIMHDDSYEYGTGESAVKLAVVLPVRRCPACEFEFLDHAAERVKHEALCRHFGVLTPWEIREIRARHGLSRAAFSELTGLGEATLGRWETGVLIQTLANDRYLRLLADPGGIERLRIVRRRSSGLPDHALIQQRKTPRFRCLEVTEEVKAQGLEFELVKRAA